MSSVTIKNVSKSYGTTKVIHDVSVDIKDGEFVILVGPSGCGKSTLLRMLAGLESITGGEICIGSKVVNNLPPKDRDIAMVFQNYALYPQMTVRQNMGFALELAHEKKEVIADKVRYASEILGLNQLLERYPRQLSGGQRQRVAMGRAIVRAPEVFLFDEPLSNLDAKLRVQMRAEIKALQKRLKTTTVYVTHDQIEAMTMADKIVVLHDGYIEQIGSPLDLYDHPANIFVASFMGSPPMNLIEGKVQEKFGKSFFVRGDTMLEISAAYKYLHKKQITLGVRPEEILIDAEHGTPAQVLDIEPTGSETYLTLDFAGKHIVCVIRERIALTEGETIPISLMRASLHAFEAESGVRIEPSL